jgi:hypothetical protein
VLDEHLGRPPHDVERVTGALGDVEQAVVTVREVQDLEHAHLVEAGVARTAHRAIESTLSEQWLAFRI